MMLAIESTINSKSTPGLVSKGIDVLNISRNIVVGTVVFALAACSSSPDPMRSKAAEQKERSSERIEVRESTAPPGGHWWGQIQDRADWAYEDLKAEIVDCLERLGDASQVREIALHAARDEEPRSPYEVLRVITHPEEAAHAEPCVAEVAAAYVDAVDTAFWDDFDTYIATFIHRGESVQRCDGSAEHALCTGVDDESDDGAAIGQAAPECDEELLDAAHAAIGQQRYCWGPRRIRERLMALEDEPIELRAVLFGELRVERGAPRIVLRYNQPWVEPMVECVVENLADEEFLDANAHEPCRTPLRNRAVTYWNRPTFTYIYE